MPRRQGGEIHRRRLAGLVAAGLDPGVLEDDRLQLGGAADQGVGLGTIAPRRGPELETDHRAVADAAIDLAKAGVDLLGTDVDEPERAMVPVAERLEHLVVLRLSWSGDGSAMIDMPIEMMTRSIPIRSARAISLAIDSSGVRPPQRAIWQCRSQIIILCSFVSLLAYSQKTIANDSRDSSLRSGDCIILRYVPYSLGRLPGCIEYP